ncbi:type I-B CRISPR-associated protein Cas7/Cst2/DevR [Methanococcus sp. CF]
MKTSHITGTILINAESSFLNGAGLGMGEDKTLSVVKRLKEGKYTLPYVSAQAWKRWLRNTAVNENNWKPSVLRAIDRNEKGNTNKIAGELNPVVFPEDDLFGYMEARSSKKGENSEKVKAVIRASPFVASILKGLRKKGNISVDDGFVHLKEGTPQPYSTQFYNTALQGLFSIDCNRVGVFNNCGDRIELDMPFAEKYLKEGLIEEVSVEDEKDWKIYQLKDLEKQRCKRISGILKAISVLEGGSKQASFGTDISPKVILLAGLNGGNPIFNKIFVQEDEGVLIKVDVLKEIIEEYSDRIPGKIYLGIRKGYLENEPELVNLSEQLNGKLVLDAPRNAVNSFINQEIFEK